jgi:VCBS repeat-containing protein
LDDHFTFTATVDGYTLSSSLDIILDRPPVVSDTDARLPVASSFLTSDASHGVLAGAADADGDTLAVSAVGGNSSGVGHSVSGQFGNLTLNADGSYAYSLTANATAAHGDDVFTFQVSDGHGGTISASLDIAVGTDPSLFGSVTHDPGSPGGETYLLYDALFGRSPDPLGLEFWAAALKGGTTADQLASDLINSDEHTQAFPNQSNTDFVDQIYQTALHRAPDAAGLASWVNALDQGASKADVLLDIANSPEHIADLQGVFNTGVFAANQSDAEVARLYQGILGHAPDSEGFTFFETAVDQGTTLTQVANDMLASSQYLNAHAGQTDTAFIESLYSNALGRQADQAGLTAWTNALANGTSHATVAIDISESPEAQHHLVGQIETGFHLS